MKYSVYVTIRYKNFFRKTFEDQFKKAEEMGVEIPKYLKPGAVNPLSYAEQVQKRKMLWKKPESAEGDKTKAEGNITAPSAATSGNCQNKAAPVTAAAGSGANPTSFNKWEATNFGDDAANEKFRRLMGIKVAAKPEEFKVDEAPGKDADKIMSDLQRNYDVARQQTHRNRGIGLGFGGGSEFAPQQQHSNFSQPGLDAVSRPSFGINFVKKQ